QLLLRSDQSHRLSCEMRYRERAKVFSDFAKYILTRPDISTRRDKRRGRRDQEPIPSGPNATRTSRLVSRKITMSVVINTNYSATVASNNLAASNSSLQKSLNRLSSGSKIVSPADDAGGLAVSMKLSAAARRQGAVASNIGNAIS